MRQVGGSVGIAVMGAIIASKGAATATVPFTIEGFQLGLRVSAGIASCGCLIAALFIREVRVRGAAPASEPEARSRLSGCPAPKSAGLRPAEARQNGQDPIRRR